MPLSTPTSESGLPPAYLPTLSHILTHITPLSKTLPLSLELLNKLPFAPESKDEDLHSGALQLPKGSVVLVTEGGVREGKLIERGMSESSLVCANGLLMKRYRRPREHQHPAGSYDLAVIIVYIPVQQFLFSNRHHLYRRNRW